jgi:hypothetical protein
MLNELKLFRKKNSGHRDYFFESEERIFQYFEITLMNQR